MTPDIIFEDNHLFVVNKPAGMLTQPNDTDEISLQEACKLYIKEKYKKPFNVFLEPIHRIDKPVSGVVVFAKTSKALTRLHQAIREKDTLKMYLAIVDGIPVDEATLEDYLFHDDFHAKVVSKSHRDAKLARLHYKTLKKMKGQTLLEIELETGRYHQIRVQLASRGFPVSGDAKYGSKTARPSGTIALHHYKMSIPHPVTKEIILLEAPCPFLQQG